jgi:hypothetical protein
MSLPSLDVPMYANLLACMQEETRLGTLHADQVQNLVSALGFLFRAGDTVTRSALCQLVLSAKHPLTFIATGCALSQKANMLRQAEAKFTLSVPESPSTTAAAVLLSSSSSSFSSSTTTTTTTTANLDKRVTAPASDAAMDTVVVPETPIQELESAEQPAGYDGVYTQNPEDSDRVVELFTASKGAQPHNPSN